MQHRGKLPYRLVQALLGCSMGQARLVVDQYNRADPDTLEAVIKALDEAEDDQLTEALPTDRYPCEFRHICDTGSTSRFWKYLERRGFDDPDRVARFYNLSCAVTGRWKDRLIIPVFVDNKLVAWQGRALQNPVSAPRYLASTAYIKKVVMNYDECMNDGGDTLFIVEGPIDAMKVDYYGAKYDIRAACTFGTSFTLDQIYMLRDMQRQFKRTIALFDPEAIGEAYNLADWLPGVPLGQLPEGVEDPGALSKAQVKQLIELNV